MGKKITAENCYLVPRTRRWKRADGTVVSKTYYYAKYADLAGEWQEEPFGTNKRIAIAEFEAFANGLAQLRDGAVPVHRELVDGVPRLRDLCADYLAHCITYYVDRDGNPTSTLDWVRRITTTVTDRYGALPATAFGPKKFRTIIDSWIDDGAAYTTVNSYIATTKRMFRWALTTEHIPPAKAAYVQALLAVPGESKRRTRAVVHPPRQPVAWEHVTALRDYVAPQLYALALLQWWSAARPGELVVLKPNMIDTSKKVWSASPPHKNEYREVSRTLFFGPNAQAILRPFLENTDPDAYLFNPHAAVKLRRALTRSGPGRRPNQKPDKRRTPRTLGDRYTVDSYRQAIERACDAAKVPKWTPHQLRHSAAQRLNDKHGIEAAQTVLEHAHLNTTQIYVKRRNALAAKIMAKDG